MTSPKEQAVAKPINQRFPDTYPNSSPPHPFDARYPSANAIYIILLAVKTASLPSDWRNIASHTMAGLHLFQQTTRL